MSVGAMASEMSMAYGSKAQSVDYGPHFEPILMRAPSTTTSHHMHANATVAERERERETNDLIII